jgi:hypothetical protein
VAYLPAGSPGVRSLAGIRSGTCDNARLTVTLEVAVMVVVGWEVVVMVVVGWVVEGWVVEGWVVEGWVVVGCR